jgi:hypothetical protein
MLPLSCVSVKFACTWQQQGNTDPPNPIADTSMHYRLDTTTLWWASGSSREVLLPPLYSALVGLWAQLTGRHRRWR